MIRCYHCGTDNLDGSEYCDECGKKLSNPASQARANYVPPPPQLNSQVAPPPPPSFTMETITPKPATPYTPPPPPVRSQGPQTVIQAPPTSAGAGAQGSTAGLHGPTTSLRGGSNNPEAGQQAVNAPLAGAASNSIRAKLIIQRGGKVGKEFPLTSHESMIGRWDADGGIFPDVDLDQDDSEAKVSRRHARIQFLNNQYLIEDMGSTNGTFINRGPRLLPGNKQPLNNGDEIIVGKTFLKFVLS
ncbi:MAG: FHA domain-containing protein [Acidobacteria bacterium]|nr:FHA domain-containing protein [Acidobacteriota bacterium]